MYIWSAKVQNICQQQQLHFKDVQADGNCLPRCIAEGVFGSEELHSIVRGQICDRLEECREYYQYFVLDGEGFEEYIKRMRRDGTWMDNFAITAACAVYNCNIIVRELNNNQDGFDITFDLSNAGHGGWDADILTDDVKEQCKLLLQLNLIHIWH